MSLFGRVAGEDSCLDSSTVSNGFVRVDALVGFFPVEEIGDELHNAGNTSGTTDHDNLVDAPLVDFGVTKDLFNRLQSAAEQVLAQFLETSTCERSVEIDTLKERVNFNGGLSSRRKGALGALTSRTETTERTGVRREVYIEVSTTETEESD